MKLMDVYNDTCIFKMHHRAQRVLTEGLITSWPVSIVIKKLRNLKIPTDPEFLDDKSRMLGIQMFNYDKQYHNAINSVVSSKVELNKLMQICQLAGYYMSNVYYGVKMPNGSYDMDDNTYTKFSTNIIPDMLSWMNASPSNSVLVVAECKYDTEIDIFKTDTIYHACPEVIYEKKISNIGLSPRHMDKLSTHPDRVYFSLIEDAAVNIRNLLKAYSKYSDFVILGVDVQRLPKNIKFYIDKNYYPFGVYTYSNISPKVLYKIS